jgi:excisionase family DNA binding protein
MSNNLIFSTIPLEDLKTVISDIVSGALDNRIQKQNCQTQDEYLTRKQTAEKLDISLPTLDKYTIEGRINGYRIGTRIRYKKTEIEQALKQIKSSNGRSNQLN